MTYIRDTFRWAFLAPELGKRLARSTMLTLCSISMIAAIAWLVISLAT